MATKLQREPAELARLRSIVEDQHRRLRMVQGDLGGRHAARSVGESFAANCAKPRVTSRALGRLLDECRLRLELQETTLAAALRATWPERQPVVPVLRPSPGLAAYALRNLPGIPNMVFSLFGRTSAEVKEALRRVSAEQQTAEPFIPVFLVNDSDFTLLRDQRLVFEYFPFVIDEAAPPPEPRWAAYFLDTIELAMRRWGVRQILAL